MEFKTVSISGGITVGTDEGLRTSLFSNRCLHCTSSTHTWKENHGL